MMISINDTFSYEDVLFYKSLDKHLPESELSLKIMEKRCYIIKDNDTPVGVLRYNLFWDLIPFLNLLYIQQPFQLKGIGSQAMYLWENELRLLGHSSVMTSTMVAETSQHFYRKLGYKDCGCLVKNSPPFVETMEMFLMKSL